MTPFLDTTPQGIFATRSPARPNPIGMSTVRLVGIDGTALEIEDVDILDGTPLLDIKPTCRPSTIGQTVRIGWLSDRVADLADARADGRFR